MRLSALVLLVLAIWGATCDRTAPVSAPQTTTIKEPRRSLPPKEEVLEYLDGKGIALTEPQRMPEKADKLHMLQKTQIEALEVGQSAGSVNDGPWTTTVTFIANTDRGRFAVKCWVHYRMVEEKCAFFGFDVKEVVKQ